VIILNWKAAMPFIKITSKKLFEEGIGEENIYLYGTLLGV
jgi:hypothetical protein